MDRIDLVVVVVAEDVGAVVMEEGMGVGSGPMPGEEQAPEEPGGPSH